MRRTMADVLLALGALAVLAMAVLVVALYGPIVSGYVRAFLYPSSGDGNHVGVVQEPSLSLFALGLVLGLAAAALVGLLVMWRIWRGSR